MSDWERKTRTLLKAGGCGTQMPPELRILSARVGEFGSLGFQAAVDFVGD
jgi:hypothetical protein